MSPSYTAIEQLLLQKRFEELTEAERTQVGLDAVAYAQQRHILQRSQAVLHKKPPPPMNRLATLQAHYDRQHATAPLWRKPLPLYQVGLLLLGLLALAFWYWPTPVVQEKIVYLPMVDTVLQVQEKVVVQEKIVYQTQVQTVRVVERDTIYVPQIDRDQFYQDKAAPTIFAKQSKSKSMKEMQGLLDFVGVNE